MSLRLHKDHKIILAVLMTIVICLIDFFTPLWFDVWVLYLIPLFFMFQAAKRPYLYSASISILIAVGMIAPASDRAQLMHAAVNRTTGMLGGWGVSILLMRLRRLQEAQRKAKDELQMHVADRTAELSQISRSLHKRNEEVFQTEKALRDSETRFRSLIDNSPLAVRISVAGVTSYVNKKYLEMFGYQENKELYGRPVMEQWASQDRAMVAERARQRELGQPVPTEYEGIGQRKDGSQFPMHVAVARVQLADGPASITFLIDISERKQAEEALRESEKKYRNIFENTQDVFYMTDLDGTILDISPSILRYSGYTREEIIGRTTETFYQNPQDRMVMMQVMQKAGEVIDYEVRMKTKDDRFVTVSVNSHFRYDQAGVPTGVEGSLRDISERIKATEELKRLNEELSCQATTDPLTGISNRSKFNEALSIELMRSRRFGLPLSVILFDVDHFKRINDTHGHNAGDTTLQYLTGLVATVVRKHDLFARWGGEEFVLMATNTGQQGAASCAEKLRVLIEKFDFPSVGHLTCSFGVTEFVAADTEDVMINRADQALYRAKAGGRNRVEAIRGFSES